MHGGGISLLTDGCIEVARNGKLLRVMSLLDWPRMIIDGDKD